MNIEQAIRDVYGVHISVTPFDLKQRKFRIDDLRNGFVMKTAKCGVFGSIIDAETYIFTDKGVTFHKQEHKDNKEIRFEWLVWELARASFERGEKLSKEDAGRLKLAVRRLEEWL